LGSLHSLYKLILRERSIDGEQYIYVDQERECELSPELSCVFR